MILKKQSFSQVKTLKERIEEEKGKDHFSVSGLKLIYAGMSLSVSASLPCFQLINTVHLRFKSADRIAALCFCVSDVSDTC